MKICYISHLGRGGKADWFISWVGNCRKRRVRIQKIFKLSHQDHVSILSARHSLLLTPAPMGDFLFWNGMQMNAFHLWLVSLPTNHALVAPSAQFCSSLPAKRDLKGHVSLIQLGVTSMKIIMTLCLFRMASSWQNSLFVASFCPIFLAIWRSEKVLVRVLIFLPQIIFNTCH